MRRKLTAILFADVNGYSRLMAFDEEATLHRLTACRKRVARLIDQHHGVFINSAGDSMLAEFASVIEAVRCAVELQAELKRENQPLPPARRMQLRIGIHLGDVIEEGDQIYGDGVNVAARLESLADPGGICLSGPAFEQIRDRLPLVYQDCGNHIVKNIARPVQVWRVVLDRAAKPTRVSRRPKHWRGGAVSLAGLAIVAGTFVLVQQLSLTPPRSAASLSPAELAAPLVPDNAVIAVLPFANPGKERALDAYSDTLTERFIDQLPHLPHLAAIARQSSFAYKGKPLSEQRIGRELGVKYLLEGSVRRLGAQLRIAVELVDADSGVEIWTQSYQPPAAAAVAEQGELVRKVTTTVGLILKLQEMRLPAVADAWSIDNLQASTSNQQALDDLLRAGLCSWLFSREDNQRARQWLEQAVALDPGSAQTYAFLGRTYWNDAWFRWTDHRREDLAHAAMLEQKALALDASNSTALALRCEVEWLERQFDRAVTDGRRAVAINPQRTEDYIALSEALAAANLPLEAIQTARLAMRLDPAGQDYYAYFVADPLVMTGRYDEAIPLLRRHVAAYPDMLWGHAMLAVAYAELGREAEARREAAEIMRISPSFVLASSDHELNCDVALNERFLSDLRKAGLTRSEPVRREKSGELEPLRP